MNFSPLLRADNLPLIKMCGLRRPGDVVAARESGADLIGMVFAPSRRRVSPTEAAAILAESGEHPPVVGVFVNLTAAEIEETARIAGLALAQLSGEEPPALAGSLSLPYIKTLHLKPDSTVEAVLRGMDRYPHAAAFLLDTWSSHGGGSGVAADWTLAAAIIKEAPGPVILAGGLNPENVGEAIAVTGAAGVDVSSGIERDGWKDPARMAAFAGQARRNAAITTNLGSVQRKAV
ncbi:MAG TPA: phosphoribosylanthranilate isomerase [Chloroflexota bacterium]|jgi:phosphoribosylanthranilate isomerase